MRAIQESVARSRQAALERTLQRQAEEEAAQEAGEINLRNLERGQPRCEVTLCMWLCLCVYIYIYTYVFIC